MEVNDLEGNWHVLTQCECDCIRTWNMDWIYKINEMERLKGS
jgi:hypothetical protein